MRLFRQTISVVPMILVLGAFGNQALSATWTPTAAGTSAWSVDADPPWDTAMFPNGVDQVASLTNNIAGTQTINLAAPITIGTLEIGDSDSTNNFVVQNGTGGSLTFDVSSGSAAINRTSGGTDTVSATITLADNLNITTSAANALAISNVIGQTGGAKSITLNGSGRVSLGGANTFTGGVTINNGSLVGTVVGAFNAVSPNVVTFAPGTTTGKLVVNNNISIGGLVTDAGNPGTAVVENGSATARTLTVNNSVANVFSGLIQNGGAATLAIAKTGAGTFTLNGSAANTYTGITRVNGGRLTLDFANLAPGTNLIDPTSPLNLAGGEFYLLGRSSGSTSQTFTSFRLLAGDSTLTVDGNGGTDATVAFANPLVVGAPASVSNASVVDFRSIGAASRVSLPTSNINGIFGAFATVNGDSWARNDGSLNNYVEGLPNASYFTTATGGNSAANYASDSNVTVTSSPTLDGPLFFNSLRFNNPGANTVTLTGGNLINSGGILVTSAVGNNLTRIAGGSIAGNTVFTGVTGLMVLQNNTANELEIASDIVDNGFNSTLNKSGLGTLTLSSTGNSYTGITFISGGTLKLGASGVIPDSSRVDFPKPTGALDLNGFDETIDALSAEGGVITNSSPTPAVLTTGSATNTPFAGSLQNGAGTVGLVKTGSSVLTLSGTSSHSGGTTVNSGTLRVNNNAALGTGSLILSGGTFDNGAAVTIPNSIVVSEFTTTNVTSTTGAMTLTGPITGSGIFLATGTANPITHIQGKINGFTGTFQYSAMSNGNSLYFDGTDPDSQNGSAAKFQVDGVATRSLRFGSPSGVFKMGELSGSGGTIRNEFPAPHILEIGHLGTDSSYGGVITNGLSEHLTLNKVGAGTLTLAGANTYTGPTKVQQGTLSLMSPFLANAADVYLSTGALLNLNFSGTDDIGLLFIDSVAQVSGTWGRIGSIAALGADHESALITGDGLLLAGLAGDYNGDNKVDASDYVLWRKNSGAFGGDPGGYNVWRANFGNPPGSGSAVGAAPAVPEPSAFVVLVIAAVLGGSRNRSRRR